MTQSMYSSRTADKFVVRLPEGMRDRIAAVARTQHRSMNSEIIARLEHSLAQRELPSKPLTVIDSSNISADEQQLIQLFRGLNNAQQHALISLLEPQAKR